MIEVLAEEEAITRLANTMAVPQQEPSVSDELLSQLYRRAIAFMGPCTEAELTRAVRESFAGTLAQFKLLPERLDQILEDLIVFGDILEMRTLSEDGSHNGEGFVLVPAPPSYVVCKPGLVAIVGVAGDHINPLTGDLKAASELHGPLRIIPNATNDTQTHLAELGMLKLSERVWLRLPQVETAEAHLGYWRSLLSLEPPSSAIPDLCVFDPDSGWKYAEKWCAPTSKHSGVFVARRPQRYGSARWCFVAIADGTASRFVDIVSPGDKLRPCDIAWRIQFALDAVAGRPQKFRVIDNNGPTIEFQFFGPLPSWCERHFSILGTKVRSRGCLFAFELPYGERDAQVKFVFDMLWMKESSTLTDQMGAL